MLELDDVLLSNGSVAQVPQFILSACNKILTEGLQSKGIFRKTGSVSKQKQIRKHLDKGGSLEKNHNVIDVANLLKTFIRELPEPLIPPGQIQEALLRCLFHFPSCKEKNAAMLMLVLLLPPISVNTLAYFLQFLEILSKHADDNLMSVDNLVKVLTPTLMPLPMNSPPHRLDSHFKIVKLLIENANLVGVVSEHMWQKANNQAAVQTEKDNKKKKIRSGIIDHVFSGCRKNACADESSSESLETSYDPSLIDARQSANEK